MNEQEIEAYLREHTLNGSIRALRDACIALGLALVESAARIGLAILDGLGM